MAFWILRSTRNELRRYVASGRWPIPASEVSSVIQSIQPGDAVFLAVSGRSGSGTPQEGYVGWGWVNTVVRNAGNYFIVLEKCRLPVDTNGRSAPSLVLRSAQEKIRPIISTESVDRIKKALHWRHPDDEVTSSPLDGEFGESWGQSWGASGSIKWADRARKEQRRAGRNDFLGGDQ